MKFNVVRAIGMCGLVLAIAGLPFPAWGRSGECPLSTEMTCAGRVPSVGPRLRVSIGRFENKSGVCDKALKTVRSRVQQYVCGSKRFSVFEKERIDALAGERELMSRGITNRADVDAPRVQNRERATHAIYGSILGVWADEGHCGTCRVELQIRIKDIRTGVVLAQKQVIGKGDASEDGTSISNDGLRNAIDDACRRAVDELQKEVGRTVGGR